MPKKTTPMMCLRSRHIKINGEGVTSSQPSYMTQESCYVTEARCFNFLLILQGGNGGEERGGGGVSELGALRAAN